MLFNEEALSHPSLSTQLEASWCRTMSSESHTCDAWVLGWCRNRHTLSLQNRIAIHRHVGTVCRVGVRRGLILEDAGVETNLHRAVVVDERFNSTHQQKHQKKHNANEE